MVAAPGPANLAAALRECMVKTLVALVRKSGQAGASAAFHAHIGAETLTSSTKHRSKEPTTVPAVACCCQLPLQNDMARYLPERFDAILVRRLPRDRPTDTVDNSDRQKNLHQTAPGALWAACSHRAGAFLPQRLSPKWGMRTRGSEMMT